MNPPALIFDLDDTLLIQEPANKELIVSMSEERGLSGEDFQSFFTQTYRETFARYPFIEYCRLVGISAGEGLWGDFGGDDKGPATLRRYLEEYRIASWSAALMRFGVPEKEAPIWSWEFVERRKARQALFIGAKELLTELKKQNYPLALLTNGGSELQWFKIKQSGLEGFFDQITVSGDHGIGKPRREIFEVLFRGLRDRTDRFVMIGNSLGSDILGARNAGIPSIWVDRGEETPRDDIAPDRTVSRLSEIPEALEELLELKIKM